MDDTKIYIKMNEKDEEKYFIEIEKRKIGSENYFKKYYTLEPPKEEDIKRMKAERIKREKGGK